MKQTPMASGSSTTTSHHNRDIAITDINQDIIRTHILTPLDGPALASFSCVSSQFHNICADESLWKALCDSNWPSTKAETVQQIISSFPSAHRSFFSDSYSTIKYHIDIPQNFSGIPAPLGPKLEPNERLIFAIDIHYGNEIIYSKVVVRTPWSNWFMSSPLRLDLPNKNERVKTKIKFQVEEMRTYKARMENNMRLSCILIDPMKKRAVNLSSRRPVVVWQHPSAGEILVHYATFMAAGVDNIGGFVKCGVDVICEGKNGWLNIKEICMQVEDLDGKILSWKDSMGILQEAMTKGDRVKDQIGKEKKMYQLFQSRKGYNILNPLDKNRT